MMSLPISLQGGRKEKENKGAQEFGKECIVGWVCCALESSNTKKFIAVLKDNPTNITSVCI